MDDTNPSISINMMKRIFRDFITDANGLISQYSYKYALSKLEGLEYTLHDVATFAGLISGKEFTEEANYWTSGIFVSAAINRILRKSDSITLDFASLGTAVDCIGYGLKRGKILVSGNAGDYLGEHMSGGEIIVEGDAGYYIGYAMSGGMIKVLGNAGGHVGRYMSGGTMQIEGQIESIARPYKGSIYHKGILQ